MKKLIMTLGAIMAINGAAQAKALVVYFSATGTTENVAKMIADASGADIWKLEPVVAYSDADLDWTNDNSRVGTERASEKPRTDLKNALVDNWDEYDTVFVGAPIWWYKASWVINDFLTQNNFGTKTVIPFCTSGSSPFGDTGTEMQKLASGGNWVMGERFDANPTPDAVNAFVARATNTNQ